MKKTIQTKRGRKLGSGYRVLYAKVGRKRRLNAATATADPHVDLESDVANVGIGKALFVILVLHLVAIAAVYTHSKFFSDDPSDQTSASAAAVAVDSEVKAPEPKTPVEAPAAQPTVAPPAENDYSNDRYIVVTGDNYSRIATVRNVDESALRALNANRPLRAGVVLDLPDELSSRPVAAASVPGSFETPSFDRVEETPAEPKAFAKAPPKAIIVKPSVDRSAETATLRDSGQRYTVKSGDTVWRIANRYKVSRSDLLKINGLSDPRKLNIGREIKIPAK